MRGEGAARAAAWAVKAMVVAVKVGGWEAVAVMEAVGKGAVLEVEWVVAATVEETGVVTVARVMEVEMGVAYTLHRRTPCKQLQCTPDKLYMY